MAAIQFYWISYCVNEDGERKFKEDVIDEHPFSFMNKQYPYRQKISAQLENAALLNWKPITKKEYFLFIEQP